MSSRVPWSGAAYVLDIDLGLDRFGIGQIGKHLGAVAPSRLEDHVPRSDESLEEGLAITDVGEGAYGSARRVPAAKKPSLSITRTVVTINDMDVQRRYRLTSQPTDTTSATTTSHLTAVGADTTALATPPAITAALQDTGAANIHQ